MGQTFNNIAELQSFIQANIKPNGNEEIVGQIMQDASNGFVKFIQQSPINWNKASVKSTAVDVVADSPVIVFINNTPTKLTWNDNIYNEYYFLNCTANSIPLFNTYYNLYLLPFQSIPPFTALHVMKAVNNLWMEIPSSGNGGNGSLPDQTDHAGQVLLTDGTDAFWGNVNLRISAGDFINATDAPFDNLKFFKYELIANWIPKVLDFGIDWDYLDDGGFRILIPGFDATTQDVSFLLLIRGSGQTGFLLPPVDGIDWRDINNKPSISPDIRIDMNLTHDTTINVPTTPILHNQGIAYWIIPHGFDYTFGAGFVFSLSLAHPYPSKFANAKDEIFFKYDANAGLYYCTGQAIGFFE